MKIKLLRSGAKLPTRGSTTAGAYDIYMPEGNTIKPFHGIIKIPLGIASEIPKCFAAILIPRSSAGIKKGVTLANTVGFIDSDYRGEWIAALTVSKEFDHLSFNYKAGDRLFQFYLTIAHTPELELVDELSDTIRGEGGIGSTGS